MLLYGHSTLHSHSGAGFAHASLSSGVLSGGAVFLLTCVLCRLKRKPNIGCLSVWARTARRFRLLCHLNPKSGCRTSARGKVLAPSYHVPPLHQMRRQSCLWMPLLLCQPVDLPYSVRLLLSSSAQLIAESSALRRKPEQSPKRTSVDARLSHPSAERSHENAS